MPLAELPVPAPECAALRLTAGTDASEPMVMSSNPEQRVVELEMVNKKLENRVADLETALVEARKIIRDRENLLTEVQFKPKDDFYAWKNPKVTDKQVKDEMETRLQCLVDQMRVMEKVLIDREQEIEYLSSQLHAQNSTSPFTSPIGSPAVRSPSHNLTAAPASPKFSFPVRSSAQGPSWSRSPMTSPMTSPAQPKKWWVFGSSAISDSNNKVQSTMVDVL